MEVSKFGMSNSLIIIFQGYLFKYLLIIVDMTLQTEELKGWNETKDKPNAYIRKTP